MVSRLFLVACVCIAAVSAPCLSLAQEDASYSFGSVVSIDAALNTVTLSEYDVDTDSDVNVTYSVNAGTVYKDSISFKDIKPGTDIDVEYIAGGDGGRVATYIGIYEEENYDVE